MAFNARTGLITLSLIAAVLVPAALPAEALAQGGGCVLVPDKHHPDDRVLRCGRDLTVRPAAGTAYHPLDRGEPGPPAAVQLDFGDLLIEFRHSKGQRDFQILTPEAIASVRGTRWAVERMPGRTSVLVLRGAVAVTRAGADAGAPVVLRRGEGVDVDAGDAPLQVKRWKRERVKALLALFPP
ncbi:MAG TPA: FecR family protein [Stellaceae bacterium]|nr:FecR family protein [Stellaceae bacterium]